MQWLAVADERERPDNSVLCRFRWIRSLQGLLFWGFLELAPLPAFVVNAFSGLRH